MSRTISTASNATVMDSKSIIDVVIGVIDVFSLIDFCCKNR